MLAGLFNLPKQTKAVLRDTPGLRHALLLAKAQIFKISRAPAGLYALCYHHVFPGDQWNFARQLDFLSSHGTFVDVDRGMDLLRSGKATTGRFFLVSFDDGYANIVDAALPVLAARRIPAIAFVIGSFLDSPPASSSDRRFGYMSRDDLMTWVAAGVEVGSHTQTHRRMIGISEADCRWELEASKSILSEATGTEIRDFACPWGIPGHDFRLDREPAIAAEVGFRSFFTTKRGVTTTQKDPMLIPRHVIEPAWSRYEIDALVGGSSFRSLPIAAEHNGFG